MERDFPERRIVLLDVAVKQALSGRWRAYPRGLTKGGALGRRAPAATGMAARCEIGGDQRGYGSCSTRSRGNLLSSFENF